VSDWHHRYRRIIDSYRTALLDMAPDACRLVDARMVEFGEEWVCNDDPIDVNALMSAPDIARQFGFNPWDVHNWARAGNLTRHGNPTRPKYRLGDVLAYQAMKKQ
jgi:hypothetical protein